MIVLDYDEEQAIRNYHGQIAHFQPLSREREAELAIKIHEGDFQARDEMIQANLRFVVGLVRHYHSRGLSVMDLISAGNMGLITATERFDGVKGYKFISYAVWWIRQSILQTIAEQSRSIRLPLNKLDLLKDIAKTARRLEQMSGEKANAKEIAVELEMSAKEVEEILLSSRSVRSLNETQGDDNDQTLLSLLPSLGPAPDALVMDNELHKQVAEMLLCLKKNEEEVIRLYFGLDGKDPMTLDQIGNLKSLTRERIRQIKERAINRMRHPVRLRILRGDSLPCNGVHHIPNGKPTSSPYGASWDRIMQSSTFRLLGFKSPTDLKNQLEAFGGDIRMIFHHKGLTGRGFGSTTEMIRAFARASGFMVKDKLSDSRGDDWNRIMKSSTFREFGFNSPLDLKEELEAFGGDINAIIHQKGLSKRGIAKTIGMIRRFALASGFQVK